MRKFLTTLAIAPATLALAACGGGGDAADPVEGEAVDVTVPKTEVSYPEVPLDARNTVDYQGTYQLRRADGTSTTIALGEDDTYRLQGEDGLVKTGEFSWYSDNSRILIRDGEENMVFGVADGYLYQLEGPEAEANGPRSADMTYERSEDAAM
ncbi:hypothetical protein [Qipengyuania sp. JC766]|uniref:hypothetical protein n=1 Tax=Qipengyuania sp. JC766 TaxID=3232139 RepID=UPI003459762B